MLTCAIYTPIAHKRGSAESTRSFSRACRHCEDVASGVKTQQVFFAWHRLQHSMGAGQPQNTLLTVARTLAENGISESYRIIEAEGASLEQFAVHGSLDETPH